MPPEPAVTGHALARGEPPAFRAVRGRPLADAVADYRRAPSPLGLHDLLRPFLAACYEIAYAHSRGATHLGLTPRLILLGEFGETAVVGWDRARPAPTGNGAPAPDGTEGDAYAAAFLAPEQAAGDAARVGPASDVYALGAVLYAILTGQPPYTGATAAEVLARVRAGLPWQPRMVAGGVPAALEAVCLTALEREPAERYRSAAELAREVERWVAGARVRTNYVEPKGVRLVRWARGGVGLTVLAGLAVLALPSLVALGVTISIIRTERAELDPVLNDNAHKEKQLEQAAAELRRANQYVTEVNRQRLLASDDFGAALQALRVLALRAKDPQGDEHSLNAWRLEVQRTAQEAARALGQRADHLGPDVVGAQDRVHVADLLLSLGQAEEARRHYERAVAIARAAVQAQPGNLMAQGVLMRSARGLGQAQLALHDPAAARLAGGAALGAAEVLAKADPKNVAARRNVAACYELVGDAGSALNDVPAAREAFTKLVATVEDYAKDDPQGLQTQLDLANGCIGRGKVERLDYRFEEAIPWYDRGTGILRKLKAEGKITAESPAAKRGREVEAMADECRAVLKAVDDINFALNEAPATAGRLLLGRAAALARRGRHADAAATAEKLRGLKPDDGANLYNVACCLALCVPAVGAGKPADALTAEEKAARADYAARAVKELRAASDHGFRDVGQIESDPDLNALHGEAGYRALVAELKALRVWLTFPVLP